MKRRILFWILIIAFGWVLIGRFNEIEKLVETLRGGRWQWVALAASLQLGYYAATSWLYQVSFTAVGVNTRWRNLLPLTFAVAFANIVPEYARNEVSIDLMRRRHEVENGTMEFLFGSLLLWSREQGYDTFNLGLSALSGVGEALDDPAAEKVMHYVYDHMNQFYNFQGLHAFKEKFNPTWEPRYIVFPGYTSLSAVWLALTRAGSGDDFWRGYTHELQPMLRQMARLVYERYHQQQPAQKNSKGGESAASTQG